MPKVTRIAYSKNLTASKFDRLSEIALRLGNIRREVWHRYGSINGVGLRDRTIRDEWMAEGRTFNVPARLWKETLRDAVSDIKAYREAAKVKVRKAIRLRTDDDDERKRLYRLLKYDNWQQDSYLRRMMRKHYKHGKSKVDNQLVADTGCYKTFQRDGKAWLAVSSLVRGTRIAIPLNTTFEPSGTVRIILRDSRAEIHYSIDEKEGRLCGDEIIGIDKGYTDAFTDSNGEVHGVGLGRLLSAESDHLKAKYQSRNKLKAVADKARKSGNEEKAKRIECNNLGRKKLNKRKAIHTANVRTVAFNAAHSIADCAAIVAVEDLTSPIKSKKKYGKNQNRRLSGWVKGTLAESLDSVFRRRSAKVILVNAAYTSQMDSWTCLLEGERKGKKFHRKDGVVVDADWNAARNILARMDDDDIGMDTPYRKVRKILEERGNLARLGLLNQDTSHNHVAVSELPVCSHLHT